MVSKRLTPIYESTATIDIDRQMPSAIIGQEATRTMANDSDQFLATQAKLIQSDSVLRPVAEQYSLLETEARSGGVDRANPASAQEAPVLLKQLKVTRPPNTYLLLISYRSADAAAGGGCRERHRAVVPGAHLQHPVQVVGQPLGVHGAPDGRAQGEDGAIERRARRSSSASST